MLYLAMIFFVMAIFSALFGFTDIAVDIAGIAKTGFVIFLTLFASSMAFGGMKRHGPRV